ncbi:MAG: hypothetical protein Fur005_45970 [Roseiflexaceae bacterium]
MPTPTANACGPPIQADEASTQSGRLAMFEDLSAAIAHEISNPICAARFALKLLEQDLHANRINTHYLQIAEEELQRVADVIVRLRTNATNPAQSDPDLAGLVAEYDRR